MLLPIPDIIFDDWLSVQTAFDRVRFNLSSNSSPTYTGLTLTGLTASRLIATNSSKVLESVTDLTSWIAGTAKRVIVTDDTDGTITLSTPQDIDIVSSPTFEAVILGSDVVFVNDAHGIRADTDDGNDNQLVYFSGGGSFGNSRGACFACYGNEYAAEVSGKLYLYGGNVTDGDIIFNVENLERGRFRAEGLLVTGAITANEITVDNTGLHIKDVGDPTYDLIIRPGSDLTQDRTLSIFTGDANRAITLNGNTTLDDWFNQSVKTSASPTFAHLSLGNGELTCGSINRPTTTLTLEIGGAAKISITSTEVTFADNIVIPDAGYIGSVSDTDAIQIEADGDIVLTQDLAVTGSSSAASLTTTGGDLSIKSANPATTSTHIRIADTSGNLDRVLMRDTSNDIWFGDIDDNSGKLYLRAGGSTWLTILEDGKVGLGQTTPTEKLHVYESINGNVRILLENPNQEALGQTSFQMKSGGYQWTHYVKYSEGNQYSMWSTTLGAAVLTCKSDGDVLIANGNLGINTATPDAKLQVVGDCMFGDDTNYTEIEADGTIEFHGAATVWNDANLGVAQLALPTASQPDEDEFVDEGGSDTGISTWAFAVGEKVSGSIEIPHDYKEGSDITFHVHWQGIAAPSGTDYVKWQCTYTVAQMEATLDAVATTVVEEAYDTQYEFKISSCTAITGTNFNIGDQFLFTLERVAAAGDAYAGDALVATVGLHYECDTVGSRQMLTKT